MASSTVVGMLIEQLADVELAYPTFTAVVGLAARRAVGDLEPVMTRTGHGTPEQTRAVEWEHRTGPAQGARAGSPDEGDGILGDPRGLPSTPTAGEGSVSQSPAKGGAMS